MQVGDRVTTHLNQTGTIVGLVPQIYFPLKWLVQVDGEDRPDPYLDEEILLVVDNE